MKKLLVVLLSLGLIVAFSTAASAVDVSFSGQYYLGGMYENNPMLTPDDVADGRSHYSHAFFYTRTRFQPVFKIAEGLTLTTRFDALEKQWGNTNLQGGGATDYANSRRYQQAVLTQGQKIQEEIEFERAYVTFLTGIGQFQVGYQNVDAWGTNFGDYNNTAPSIRYAAKVGPLTLALIYEKFYENDTAGQPATYTNNVDADNDTYAIAGIYNGKGLEAGLLYKYYALNKTAPLGYKTQRNLLSPYLKATFGPVYIEGEFQYWFGKAAEYEAPLAGTADVDLQAYGAYLMAKMNAGPAYFGALFAYLSGDDMSDATKTNLNPGGHGSSFVHSLIMMNEPLATWSNSGSTAALLYGASNMFVYNAFGGFNPTPKWNVEANLTYADVEKIPTGVTQDKHLGMEFDVTATYKIYDNLSYMVGAGYLWTGDYFKGATNAPKEIDNDYVLKNQLTLSF